MRGEERKRRQHWVPVLVLPNNTPHLPGYVSWSVFLQLHCLRLWFLVASHDFFQPILLALVTRQISSNSHLCKNTISSALLSNHMIHCTLPSPYRRHQLRFDLIQVLLCMLSQSLYQRGPQYSTHLLSDLIIGVCFTGEDCLDCFLFLFSANLPFFNQSHPCFHLFFNFPITVN